MTRERAKELAPIIAAYGEGKEIQFQYSEDEWWPVKDQAIWRDDIVYRIKPEPKKRPMTREEVLGFLANTPGIVVQCDHSQWCLPGDWMFDYKKPVYAWATIGTPNAFEVEE